MFENAHLAGAGAYVRATQLVHGRALASAFAFAGVPKSGLTRDAVRLRTPQRGETPTLGTFDNDSIREVRASADGTRIALHTSGRVRLLPNSARPSNATTRSNTNSGDDTDGS